MAAHLVLAGRCVGQFARVRLVATQRIVLAAAMVEDRLIGRHARAVAAADQIEEIDAYCANIDLVGAGRVRDLARQIASHARLQVALELAQVGKLQHLAHGRGRQASRLAVGQVLGEVLEIQKQHTTEHNTTALSTQQANTIALHILLKQTSKCRVPSAW